MKYLFLIFFFVNSSFASQNVVIKSIKTYAAGDRTGFPINNITIEFDIKADTQPSLKILFRLCDKNWQPYENLFLINKGYDTEYNLWFDNLPANVERADYHYKGTFPSKDVSFPFSGKWKFFIIDAYDDDIVYAEGRFFVIQPQLKMDVRLTKSRLEGVNLVPNSLERVFNLEAEFKLNDTLVPSRVMHVEIIENFKFDYPVIINRDKYNDYRFYEWNASDQFTFIAKDIFPGNEYRQANIRDSLRFSPPSVNAQIDRIETSRLFQSGRPDLNGSFLLTNFKSDYAQYMDVNFELRPPEEPYGDIYLVGAFNNWDVLPQFKMNNSGGLYSTTVELKRGVYDYQYVIAEERNGKIEHIDWYLLEGNFWETSNDYHIFLYYDSPLNGGFDQIIGFAKVNSRGL